MKSAAQPGIVIGFSILSAATGFLAGVATFSGRVAVVENETRQLEQIRSEVAALRRDVQQVADKIGVATIAYHGGGPNGTE